MVDLELIVENTLRSQTIQNMHLRREREVIVP